MSAEPKKYRILIVDDEESMRDFLSIMLHREGYQVDTAVDGLQAVNHLREHSYGSFARSITLPAGVKSDKIEGNCKTGVLTLRLPKAEEIKPRKIPIKAGVGHKVIEAEVVSNN